ncbi:hypothetical protein EJ04DRAFT_433613 [Polyplosphaeria fusca]|uniref:N-acetyltransferase domain-containing protein n=1 Tax=Polyplosphaeria fusca TaxID=682080 RepID=A0A9P4QYU5_9PLEO|nr:hypothetical protein EJ04DRAFT_433613 [Polyplosphaeria fusca]
MSEPALPPSPSHTPSSTTAEAAAGPVLRLASAADLPAIARCWYEGFFDDEVIGEIMHPRRSQFPEDVYWFLLRGIRERFWDYRHQFVVVVVREQDGQDRVVGAADWRRLGEGGQARELWAMDPRNLVAPALHLYHQTCLRVWPNRAADPNRKSFLSSAVEDSKRFWTGERAECWDLHVCGVHPKYQRRGIGKLLVRWGVQRAEEEGACASVICGAKNRGFYASGGLTELAGKPGTGEGGGIVLFTESKK